MDKSNFIKIGSTLENVRNIKSITFYERQEGREFRISYFDNSCDSRYQEKDDDDRKTFNRLLEFYKSFKTK
jgi:hypothetical protein